MTGSLEPASHDHRPLQVLVLFDDYSLHVSAIDDHLRAFQRHSSHRIAYEPATFAARCRQELDAFDAVVAHYSIRVNRPDHLSAGFAERLRRFEGLKVLFLQDEYEQTNRARQAIGELGVHVVWTCVPPQGREQVYPAARFPGVRFVPTLTGYAPSPGDCPRRQKPIAERPVVIGYRARPLGYWYGDLGQEKLLIGRRMRDVCEARGIPVDIEWAEEQRIYGRAWSRFLQNCRATLGTESGANVFDDDGRMQAAIRKELEQQPETSYHDIHSRYLKDHEGRVCMNQVSPKIFEAVAQRTALILFEGGYSGVVRPDLHFIPLQKDFRNVEEVLEKVADTTYLTELTDRAFHDVIASGRYGYPRFVREFDAVITSEWQRVRRAGSDPNRRTPRLGRPAPVPRRRAVLRRRLKWLWYRMPQRVRALGRPALVRGRRLLD